nr:unnamed protein product [Spirometra erinaceieuropaei]
MSPKAETAPASPRSSSPRIFQNKGSYSRCLLHHCASCAYLWQSGSQPINLKADSDIPSLKGAVTHVSLSRGAPAPRRQTSVLAGGHLVPTRSPIILASNFSAFYSDQA